MKAIHLVLSAGGARTFTYIGAIRTLQRAGVEIKSISCCSAGTSIGALLAAGKDFEEIAGFLRKKPLKQFLQHKTGCLPLQHLFRYPFAKYHRTSLPQLFVQLNGKDLLLQELKIPFSTIGLDIVNDRFIVFSNETHHTRIFALPGWQAWKKKANRTRYCSASWNGSRRRCWSSNITPPSPSPLPVSLPHSCSPPAPLSVRNRRASFPIVPLRRPGRRWPAHNNTGDRCLPLRRPVPAP